MAVLSVDIGTTNVKATTVDEDGRVVKAVSRELNLLSPVPGAAEHSPRELLAAVSEASRVAAKGCSIEAVVLSCYQHGLLLADGRGDPLTNILTHMDCRSAPYAERLERECNPRELYERTGCPPLFVYAVPKILWLKHVRPDVTAEASYYFLVKDFVVAKAVGEPYIDYGNASGSQLFNISMLKWDDLALQLAGVGEEQLATPVEGARILCELKGAGAELFGVKPGTPLVVGTFDGAAQNLGLQAVAGGEAALNLGTTAVVRLLSRKPVLDKSGMRLFCYYAAAGNWAFGGSTNNGGSVLRWFRDTLGWLEATAADLLGLDPYDVITAEAEKAEPGASGLIFLPFMAGERFPFRDPYSRGTLIGLRYDHRKEHIVRAFMEGVALTLKAIIDVMVENEYRPYLLLGGGGGLRSKLWARIIADATETPVARVAGGEYASNRGAAALAYLALGAASSFEKLEWKRVIVDIFEPSERGILIYREAYRRFVEAYKLLSTLYSSWHSAR